MSSLLLLFIFVPVLTGILLALNLLLAVHRPDDSKVSAYECGFSPIYGQTRSPFHVQFYIVGILFLIFDLELLLVYPIAVTLYQVSAYGFWILIIFFLVLTVGFVLEIGSGALYFTENKSTLSDLRPDEKLPTQPLSKNPSPFQNSQIIRGMGGSRLIHTKASFLDKPSDDSLTDQLPESTAGIYDSAHLIFCPPFEGGGCGDMINIISPQPPPSDGWMGLRSL
jgi:NADH-ubiquinone oxidoreductase chain 3